MNGALSTQSNARQHTDQGQQKGRQWKLVSWGFQRQVSPAVNIRRVPTGESAAPGERGGEFRRSQVVKTTAFNKAFHQGWREVRLMRRMFIALTLVSLW